MEGDERTWQWRTEGPILLGEGRRKQQELQREIDATAGPLEPVVKRKRKRVQVARACQQCRRTKSACSGYRPCANCVRKGHECVATDGTKYTASDSSGVNSSVVEWPSASIEMLLEMISDLKRSNGLLLQENRRLRLQCAGIHASATAPHPPVPLSSENSAHPLVQTSLLSWNVGNATIARSIWRISDMHLLSYNETFMTRCGQSTSTLSDFSCMKLIPMTYHHKCMQVAMSLMSGKSTSVRMIQLWNVGDRLIPMRTEIEILSNCGDGEARVIMANELVSSFVPGTEFQLDFSSSSSASHIESSDPGSMQSGDCSDSPLSSMRGEESMINEVFDMLYENSRIDERCGPQHPQSTGFVWEETISSRE